METLDVKGLSCPLPVLKTKKILEKGIDSLIVVGTGNTALQNVTRFAVNGGYTAELSGENGVEWVLTIKRV